MSYRLPEYRRAINDVAIQSVIRVDNGTISRIAIPCFYGYGLHSNRRHRILHDHFGWPSPDNPDHSCQLPPSKYDKVLVVNEINLVDEGYTDAQIAFVNKPTGLTADVSINGHVVELVISAMCSSLDKDDIDVPFSIYVSGHASSDDNTYNEFDMRDVVTKGILHIVAGPLGSVS